MAFGAHLATLQGHGYRHAWVNDMDRDACDTLRHNLPIDPDMVFCSDVKDVDFSTLSAIDGLVFGFPCNDFSVVGDRQGIGPANAALWAVPHVFPVEERTSPARANENEPAQNVRPAR